MRKKLFPLLLAMLMFLSISACQSAGTQPPTVENNRTSAQTSESTKNDIPVILIDSPNFNSSRNLVLQYAQYLYKGYRVQLKVLPQTSEKREAELSALRVEIMAGGGPDAFILSCENNAFLNDGGPAVPLFANVNKSMRSKIFLPLDDLIAKSEYLDMEDHHEIIMNAGKTEEGQMVLPLLYRPEVYFIYKDSMDDPDIELNTWDDVLACEDQQVLSFLRRKSFSWFGLQYPRLVDYDSENLLVTPEQIHRDLKAFINVSIDADTLIEPDLTHSFEDWALDAWAKEPENIRVLSVPNEDGGLTASITAFTAINRNTEHAEEVFKFIELLYADEVQNNEGVYLDADKNGENGRWYAKNTRPSGILIGSTSGIATHKNAYPDIQGELVAELTGKVNAVRFESNLDAKMIEARRALSGADIDDAALQTYIKDICDEMEMILAE